MASSPKGDGRACEGPRRLPSRPKQARQESNLQPPVLERTPSNAGVGTNPGTEIAYGQNLRRGLRISRADVAHLMLRVLEQAETIKQVVGIAN